MQQLEYMRSCVRTSMIDRECSKERAEGRWLASHHKKSTDAWFNRTIKKRKTPEQVMNDTVKVLQKVLKHPTMPADKKISLFKKIYQGKGDGASGSGGLPSRPTDDLQVYRDTYE